MLYNLEIKKQNIFNHIHKIKKAFVSFLKQEKKPHWNNLVKNSYAELPKTHYTLYKFVQM